MRRLFWTFPDGLPGAGLLLLRLATGGVLLYRAVTEWFAWPPALSVARAVGESVAALFLLAGFGTPLWGAATAVTQVWRLHAGADEPLTDALLATLGVALALLGAGAVSVDARLFGWRRIDIAKARQDQAHPDQ